MKPNQQLIKASKEDDLDKAKEANLVENRADIHAKNDYALRWASLNGHLEIVKYLIENGADIHVYNDIALRLASYYGHLEVVKYLVEKGADIHAQDNQALRYASYYGHLEVVKYLISKMDREYVTDKFPEFLKYTNKLLRKFIIED